MNKKPLIIASLIIGLFIAAYIYIPKTYNVYQEAVEMAKVDPFIQSTLGHNVHDGFFAYANIHKSMARIEVPLSGEKSQGLLLIRGRKIDNNWVLTHVLFEHETLNKRHLVFSNKP